MHRLARVLLCMGMCVGLFLSPGSAISALATGPYASMETTIERTFLRVPVVNIYVRFDEATQDKLQELVSTMPDGGRLETEIAEVVRHSDEAAVRLTFLRSVGFGRFLREARNDLRKAWEAGMIDQRAYAETSHNLPIYFEPIAERGLRAGDQLIYRVGPASLHTQLYDTNGELLLDIVQENDQAPTTLLSAYFAPGSAARRALIESIL